MQLLMLTPSADDHPLPSLALLSHRVQILPATPDQLVRADDADLVILDGRTNLVAVKSMAQILRGTDALRPILLVVTEGGLAAVTPEWGVADVVLTAAGPAEVDARIRLAVGRVEATSPANQRIHHSGVTIDEANYSAAVRGRPLDLTYKEFELLRFLAANPSRVFTREQLLSSVWGYDYFGGTRTVDVHVRRLRAKLGDLEGLIGTVRNVGYRFNREDTAVNTADVA